MLRSLRDLAAYVEDGAACRDDNPETWFPDGEGDVVALSALATCVGCPVRAACLTLALELGPAADYGIWGGVPERQRRKMRRELLRGRQTGDTAPLAAPAANTPRTPRARRRRAA